MRYQLLTLSTLWFVPAVAAQSGTASPAVQVTLVARKLGTVGVLPTGAEASPAGLPPDAATADGAPRPDRLGVTTHWNLSPAQVGDVRLRTTRTASCAGAAYIERRVLLTAPVARVRQALDLAPPASADSLIVVRLVVY